MVLDLYRVMWCEEYLRMGQFDSVDQNLEVYLDFVYWVVKGMVLSQVVEHVLDTRLSFLQLWVFLGDCHRLHENYQLLGLVFGIETYF